MNDNFSITAESVVVNDTVYKVDATKSGMGQFRKGRKSIYIYAYKMVGEVLDGALVSIEN